MVDIGIFPCYKVICLVKDCAQDRTRNAVTGEHATPAEMGRHHAVIKAERHNVGGPQPAHGPFPKGLASPGANEKRQTKSRSQTSSLAEKERSATRGAFPPLVRTTAIAPVGERVTHLGDLDCRPDRYRLFFAIASDTKRSNVVSGQWGKFVV